MTDKNRTAHQRNGRQSRGAATPQGKERSRAAHLRHGFYSQQREEALCALGEDPAELAALIESTREEWRPASDFQERMAERMARLWWRAERAERIQESLTARQVQENEKRRHQRALELRYQLSPQLSVLHMLQEYSPDPRFYVPRLYFRIFQEGFGDKVEGAQKRILLLMHRLRKPQGPLPSVGPSGARPAPPPGAVLAGERSAAPTSPLDREVRREAGRVEGARAPAAPVEAACPPGNSVGGACLEGGTVPLGEEAEDQYLADMEELDDDDFPLPWPQTPVAEGAERDELREAVGLLARIEWNAVHAALDPEIEEQERPLSRIEGDEAQAAPHRHAELMRREEGSCFRQFMRLANLLLKIQKQSEKCARNEGSSGYVDENTEGGKVEPGTTCPELVNASTAGKGQTAESEVGKAESEVRSPGSEVGKAESGVQGSRSADGKTEFEVQKPGSEVKKPGFEAKCPRPEVGKARAGVESSLSGEVEQATAQGCAA